MYGMLLRSRVGMPVDFLNDVLGTFTPPRRSQILMVRGISIPRNIRIWDLLGGVKVPRTSFEKSTGIPT